jgi:plasmid stabilization system protein ParE
LIVVYRRSALRDVAWFHRYYNEVFPAGRETATGRLRSIVQHLADQPHLGVPHGPDDARRFPIPRIPFTLIYRIREDRIEILRLLDQRGLR